MGLDLICIKVVDALLALLVRKTVLCAAGASFVFNILSEFLFSVIF